MTSGWLWSGKVSATAERRISTTTRVTRTAGPGVHVLGIVRSLCLILAAAVACGFASPLSAPTRLVTPPERAAHPEIRWRNSVALGTPAAGRLVRGVLMPRAGRTFFTWDPVLRRAPNRAWRRWGT